MPNDARMIFVEILRTRFESETECL